MDYIMIDSDLYDDVGKEYKLISLYRRPESTATELVLEYDGLTLTRTVPYHSIQWIEK